MDGLWSSPDLPGLLRLAARNRDALDLSGGWFRFPAQVARTATHRLRRNTRSGSRRNIAAHYDLGNDFYRLFLDPSLTYSSAVFETADQSLEDAQRAKYRRVAANAGLEAGQHVLEIGTGWGGFALYAAGELGCRVTSITVSQEQFELARARVREAGLDGSGRHPAPRLSRRRRHVRRHRLDRDAGGGGRRVPADVLRDLRSGAPAGRPAQPAGHHLPGCRLRAPAPRGQLDPDLHLPGRTLPVPRRDRAGDPTDAIAHHERDRHRRRLCPDAGGLACRVPRPPRRRARARVRRAIPPHVGVLPRLERGRVRDGSEPGPADRRWSRAAASGSPRRRGAGRLRRERAARRPRRVRHPNDRLRTNGEA